MGVIAAYRRVLGNSDLTRLLFGEFVSSIGDWLYLVALLVLIWDATKDPVTLGIIGAARIVPYIVLSIPAGIVADRYDRRKVLLTTDIIRGLIMLLIAGAVYLQMSIWVVVALAIVATCFSSFFSPTIGAYLPSLVRDESELGPANSAWSSLVNLAFFIGPAFAAILLSLGSLVAAFLLNALTFGVVAVVLLGLPSKRPAPTPAASEASESAESVESAKPSKPIGLMDALRPIRRPLIGLSLLNVVVGFVWGGLSVVTVILSVQVFKIDEAQGTGLLNAAIGVGGVLGALVAGALVLRRRQGPPLVIGAAALGVGLALVGQVPSFVLALVAIGFASAGALLVEIVMTTLLQRIVPDSVRGRALGLIETGYVLFYAAGAFVIPIVASGQAAMVLLVSGAAIAIAGVISLVLLGSFAVAQPAADARRRLADVALFAGLPPGRLETAMRHATLRDVKAGTTIIRQGDAADFFYVINSGRVEVTQTDASGASHLLRQMGPAEFFGEIGLLSRVPRTATVVALTDCSLVALDGAAFLELVESGPGLTYTLLNLHRGAVGASSEAS